MVEGSQQRILCIGAHPDDVEIGMGGTVAGLASRGHDVLLLDLTNGEPTPRGSVETRMREAAASAEVLGVRRRTLDMPNRYLEDTIENRYKVASQIREFRPNYIFAPYFDDAHPDHIAAGHLSEASRFYAKLTKTEMPHEPWFPKRVIFYFPVHLRLRKEPSFLNNISDELEKKEKAIRCYESQFAGAGKEEFIELVLNENRYWGFQGGCRAAEPFFQKEAVLLRGWPEGYR